MRILVCGSGLLRSRLVEALSRTHEVFHIVADLPHRKYLNDKAKRMLSWQPCDTFERHLLRDAPE